MMQKLAIIGCGLAGVTAATFLQDKYQITIFDKSRGMGGRMCTKRLDDYHFDHGAQYFTIKEPEFSEFLEPAFAEGLIAKWPEQIALIDKQQPEQLDYVQDNIERYIAVPQMNQLVKFLAKNFKVELATQITELKYQENKWQLKIAEEFYPEEFDQLIIAIPAEQALNLLPANHQFIAQIKQVKMLGCYSLMLAYKNKLSLEFAAAQISNSKISWLAVNNSKAGRPNGYSLLAHSDNDWAEQNLEAPQEIIEQKLIDELGQIINLKAADLAFSKLHRWRYADVSQNLEPDALYDKSFGLGICGDYFISGRVASAFKSAKFLSELMR